MNDGHDYEDFLVREFIKSDDEKETLQEETAVLKARIKELEAKEKANSELAHLFLKRITELEAENDVIPPV